MSEQGQTNNPKKPQRKPYESPAVVSTEVFETMALSCASSGFACPIGNPDRS